MKNNDISELRLKLDEIDISLIDLFLKRMQVCSDISSYKFNNGLPVLDRDREEIVLTSRLNSITDKVMWPYAKSFILSLLEISKALQKDLYKSLDNNLKVSYQGVPGSNSYRAAQLYFRDGYTPTAYLSFADVFNSIVNSESEYGVLPIENSSTGSVVEVYDLLIKYGFYIVGEEVVSVDHCLLGIKGSTIDDIKSVLSHEQGLWQCSGFLSRYPLWEQRPYHNTAVSAKFVADQADSSIAAIASKEAAAIYNLDILQEGIQDQENNYTRFIIVSTQLRRDDRCNKVSLSFVLKHEAGSLSSIINTFADSKINLLKLESRPIPGRPWEYRFYIDIEANMESDDFNKALAGLVKFSHEWRLLGNYPGALVG